MHDACIGRRTSNQETYLLWQVPQTVLGVRRVDEVGIREQSPELHSNCVAVRQLAVAY